MPSTAALPITDGPKRSAWIPRNAKRIRQQIRFSIQRRFASPIAPARTSIIATNITKKFFIITELIRLRVGSTRYLLYARPAMAEWSGRVEKRKRSLPAIPFYLAAMLVTGSTGLHGRRPASDTFDIFRAVRFRSIRSSRQLRAQPKGPPKRSTRTSCSTRTIRRRASCRCGLRLRTRRPWILRQIR